MSRQKATEFTKSGSDLREDIMFEERPHLACNASPARTFGVPPIQSSHDSIAQERHKTGSISAAGFHSN